MVDLAFLQWTPLASAVLWLGAAVYQVARDRFRTWSEAFLLATFFFVGAYALSDAFMFNARSVDAGLSAARMGLSFISLAVAAFFLFALTTYTHMRRALFLVFLPTAAAVAISWTTVVTGVIPEGPGGPVFVVTYDTTWFAIWAFYAASYSLAGIWDFYLTYREVRKQTPRLGRRLWMLLVAVMLTFALGAGTDMLLALLNIHGPSVFSTFLIVPGLVALFALSPLGELGIPEAVRRWKARGYEIKAVFLTHRDSTLLGAKVEPMEVGIDQDLLTRTLGVIQNFMRTSFPMLRGGSLRTITLGGYTLAIERGRYVYLVVVLNGRETDPLRRQMRDALLAFEARNQSVLAHWRGAASDAAGLEDTLAGFFSEATPPGG